MAIKHLISAGIGFSSGTDYPKFGLTRGLSIGAAIIAAVGNYLLRARRRARR